MYSAGPIADDGVMNQKPTPDTPPRTKDVSPRTKKGGLRTVGAFVLSAVLMLGVFLLATWLPAVGLGLVCFGVVIKGATSLMEALMKTENDEYWRPDVRKSIAQMNVFAVIFVFPPLLKVAAEKLFDVLPL